MIDAGTRSNDKLTKVLIQSSQHQKSDNTMSFSASIEQHISCEDIVKIAEKAGQKIMEIYNSPVRTSLRPTRLFTWTCACVCFLFVFVFVSVLVRPCA